MRGFISYAHDDVAFLERFRVHLKAVEEAFGVTFWSDESLRAGHHWNDTIRDAINQADVFVMLVSPSWIASKFIRDEERPAINARCAAIKGLIVPVVLMPCDWERVVGSLQVAPIQGRRPLPVTNWDRDDHGFDAARVQIHAAIRDHFSVTDARYPDTDVLVGLLPGYPGPVVIERGDRLDLDLAGDAGDIAATNNLITRQLHPPNRQKALDLVKLLIKADNLLDSSWDKFVSAAEDLAAALDRPVEDIPAHLGTVWEASVRFASFLLKDKRLREVGSTDPEPLPNDIHDAFDDLVGSVAPWIRRFPSARELDDDRGSFLTRSELFAPSVRVIRNAIAADLLTPASAQMLTGGIETAERDDTVQAAKAGTFTMKAARGLLTRGASYAAGFLAGAVASAYATESPLMQRIGRFLAGVEADGIALVADMPRDIRHGMERTFEQLGKPAFPLANNIRSLVSAVQNNSQPHDAALLPEGFLELAQASILRGETPPAPWWPFIVSLDFSPIPELGHFQARSRLSDLRPLSSLTNLQSLILVGSQVSDLTPLSGLANLRFLDIDETPVTNVRPLSGLTALQALYLDCRQVVDIGAVAMLSELHTLTLNNSQVSDLSPLKEIVSIKTLFLRNTPVSDLSPLGSLTALEVLNLKGTRVSDAKSLGALTALQSLDLGATKVSNLIPLSMLTALQSLYLNDTSVSDLTPLSALTSLQTLDLMRTQVSDVTPIGAMTDLQSLNLLGTSVDDVTPLGTLTTLQSLNLMGTRVSDVASLGKLIALRSLNLAYSGVSDLMPLGGLTALLSLDLRSAPVHEVTPLGTLRALRSLILFDTRVRDVTPLSALTALRSLNLNGTLVSDVTPLNALPALQSLYLSGTQVTDVTPLASLRSLRMLDITGIRPSGVDVLRRPGLEIVEGDETRRTQR